MDRIILDRIKWLLRKKFDGTLTVAEAQELDTWAETSARNKALLQRVSDPEQLVKDLQLLQESNENIFARLRESIPELKDEKIPSTVVHRVHFLHRGFLKYAAAVLLIAAIAGWFWIASNKEKSSSEKVIVQQPVEIPPGGNKAVLTLADGSSIILDSTGNGTIAQQGNTRIEKLNNGEIRYNNTGATGTVMNNTMRTPRGGQFQLTLPDGTRVWLNAASSITYPVAFSAAERKVSITGEVYFETTKDPGKPFLINIEGRSIVKVLGTSFNVNAYNNETFITTTLLNGSVQVQSNSQSMVLKPGQQSLQSSAGDISINPKADTERAIAWKNGRFDFNGLDLTAIMKQLERWYDIETEFNGPGSKEIFKGRLTRDLSLNQVLVILGNMDVKYKLNGRKLILY